MPESSSTRKAPIDEKKNIQLPTEWVSDLGLGTLATLERTPTGILVRPGDSSIRHTWREIFANKLSLEKEPVADDCSELSGDDLIL